MRLKMFPEIDLSFLYNNQLENLAGIIIKGNSFPHWLDNTVI